MTTKRLARFLIVGFVLAAGAAAALVVHVLERSRREHAGPWRSSADREAYLEETVRGYVSDDEIRNARFRVTCISYLSGGMREWEYAGGSVTYRTDLGSRSLPLFEVRVEMDAYRHSLVSDILNIVAKEKLWEQVDVKVEAIDGGEREYEFSVLGRTGRFKLINAHLPHLVHLSWKCEYVFKSLRRAARGAFDAELRKYALACEGRERQWYQHVGDVDPVVFDGNYWKSAKIEAVAAKSAVYMLIENGEVPAFRNEGALYIVLHHGDLLAGVCVPVTVDALVQYRGEIASRGRIDYCPIPDSRWYSWTVGESSYLRPPVPTEDSVRN